MEQATLAEMEGYQKVYFHLEKDEDGYPPQDWESLWAKEVTTGVFQIDNIPFFAYGVSDGDLVTVVAYQGELHFNTVLSQSGHSVIRVVVFNSEDVTELRNSLQAMHCATELSHISCLVAVDVPPSVRIQDVREYLDRGEQIGRWEYEEASLQHN